MRIRRPLWHGKSAIKRPLSAEPSPHHSSHCQSWRLQAASPLPPPLWSSHTHARTRELVEHHARTAPPLSSLGAALVWDGDDRDLPQRGSRPRKRMQALGQAQRPGRRRPLSRATCALIAAAGARRRHAPMSREARVRQPEPGGSASQHVTFAPYLPK